MRLESWAQNTRCNKCEHRHHYDKGPCNFWAKGFKADDPKTAKRCGCKKCDCNECRWAKIKA